MNISFIPVEASGEHNMIMRTKVKENYYLPSALQWRTNSVKGAYILVFVIKAAPPYYFTDWLEEFTLCAILWYTLIHFWHFFWNKQ